jgi:hypothetical protein
MERESGESGEFTIASEPPFEPDLRRRAGDLRSSSEEVAKEPKEECAKRECDPYPEQGIHCSRTYRPDVATSSTSAAGSFLSTGHMSLDLFSLL